MGALETARCDVSEEVLEADSKRSCDVALDRATEMDGSSLNTVCIAEVLMDDCSL